MGLFGGNKHKMTAEEIRKQRAKENEIFDNKDGKTNDVKVNDQGRIEYIHTPPEDTKEIMWERKQERFLQSRYEELKKNGPSYSTRYYRKKLDDKAEETMTSYPTVMTHTLELKKIFDDINFETYQSFTDKMSLVEWDLYIEELAKEFEKIRFPYTTERQYFNDLSDFGYEKFFEKYKHNLSENGVIITDNLFFHGMVENPELTHNYSTIKLLRKIRKFVSFLQLNPEFKTTINNIGDGVSLSMLNPDFIQPEFKAVTESADVKIAREIEYGHKIYSVLENGKNTGIFSYYKKEDYLVIGLADFFDRDRIEITLRNMLMLVRKDAIANSMHLIKIKLPPEYRFDGIKESGLKPETDGFYIHKL